MMRPLLLLLLLLGPALAQDEDKSLDNYRRFLARSPYHERVFEQLMRRLRSRGEVESFLAQLVTAEQGAAGAVLEARLRAEQGQVEAAIALLEGAEGSEGDDAKRLALLAEFRARAGDRAGARADLQAAIVAAQGDVELSRALLEELSAAQLAAGDRGAARASLERLADLTPEDAAARLEVGDRLANAGFHRAAVVQFERAVELARDPARRCDALASLGGEYERLNEEPRAIEIYLQALPQLRRGHWLAEDLRGRLLLLFERGGRPEELVELQRAAVAAGPGEPGAREFLALALERAGRPDEALAVLGEALARFPDDADLSAHLRTLARRSGDHGAEVTELQRLLARRPKDVELAFDLGQALAGADRVEAAASRWRELSAQRPEDASLARRMAESWVRHGQAQHARAEFERALELAPDDVERHLDLARFLVRNGLAPEAQLVLQEAERSFLETPRALVRVGEAWGQVLRREDSVRCWRAALALLPDDAQLRFRLGVLLVELREVEEGREHLRGTASRAREWGLARLAAFRYVQTLGEDAARTQALRRVEQRLAREPGDRGAHLVVIEVHRRDKRDFRVRRAWQRLIEARPEDTQARLDLAAWLMESKRLADALKEYQQALPLLPGRAREILLAQSSAHAQLDQTSKALLCLERVLELDADDAEALGEVARRFALLGRPARALSTWEQVLAHRPDDGGAHLEAARVAQQLKRVEQALAHLRSAWRDRAFRALATDGLIEVLGQGERMESEITALDARVRADPFDLDAALLAADILAGAERQTDALARVDASLSLRPYSRDLLERRASLCLELGRSDEALEAYARLRANGRTDALIVTVDMVDAHLQAGLIDSAVQLAAEMSAPLEALQLFRAAQLRDAEVQLLQAIVARPSPEPEAFERLASLCEDLERWDEALAALEGLRQVSVTGWQVTRRVGRLRQSVGDLDGARAEGARLLGEVDDRELAQRYFERIDGLSTFYKLTTERVLATPRDEHEVRETLALLHREGQRGVMIDLARRLRTKVIAARAYPSGYTLEAWARWLHGVELGAHALCRPELIARRVELLRAKEESGRLTEKLAVDLVWLLDLLDAGLEEERALLERLTERYPRSPALLYAAAEFFLRDRDPRAAAGLYRRVMAALSEPMHAREVHASEARLRARHEAAVGPRLAAGTALDEGGVQRALDLSFDPDAREVWSWRVFPEPFDVRLGWALAEAQANRIDAARSRFTALERGLGPDELARRARLAAALGRAGVTPQDGRVLEDLAARVAALRSHPELSGTVAAVRSARFLAAALATWERVGREAEAFVLIRGAGHRAEARDFLFRHRFYQRAQAYTRLRFEQAKVALAGSAGLERERALRRLHDTAVMYAEALRAGGAQGDHEQRSVDEEAVWSELGELHPGDLALTWRQAGRADWAGDWLLAAERHGEGARARRELATGDPALVAVWKGQLLTELIPPRDQAGRVPGWQELRFQSMDRDPLDPTPHQLGALHAYLMIRYTGSAVGMLEALLAPPPGAPPHGLSADTIEEVLAAENYGEHEAGATGALERWREGHSGTR